MASSAHHSDNRIPQNAAHSLTEEAEDLASIEEAIAEWRAGDEGVPLDEAFEAIRRKYRVNST